MIHVLNYLELFGGLTYLLLSGDLLVRGALALARRAHIPPMVVGLTVVAFGTSAPELVVTTSAVLSGYTNLAVGNVVGSNVANVLLVLGIPALISAIRCDQRTARRDASFMLAATALFVGLCVLAPLGVGAGVVLLVALALVLWPTSRELAPEALTASASAEFEWVLGLPTRRRMIALFIALGLIGLPLGARLAVEGAIGVAREAGIGEAVVGLSIVALGTSLPELATTLVAAMRKESDVAIGNVLGSNVFNLLAVMGIATVLSPTPIVVSRAFLRFDFPVMIGAALILWILIWWGKSIGRRIGVLFLCAYATYLLLLFGVRGAGP